MKTKGKKMIAALMTGVLLAGTVGVSNAYATTGQMTIKKNKATLEVWTSDTVGTVRLRYPVNTSMWASNTVYYRNSRGGYTKSGNPLTLSSPCNTGLGLTHGLTAGHCQAGHKVNKTRGEAKVNGIRFKNKYTKKTYVDDFN